MSLVGRLRAAASRGRRSLAAEQITAKTARERPGALSVKGWQREAWRLYRHGAPEASEVIEWRADAISNANLYVGVGSRADTTGPEPTDEGPPNLILSALGSDDPTGFGELLRRTSILWDVAGEYYLILTDVEGSRVPRVELASSSQLVYDGVTFRLQTDEDFAAARVLDADTTQIIRIWQPDNEYPWRPTSNFLNAMPVITALQALTDRVTGTARSRLMNKLLLISDQVIMPTSQRPDLSDDDEIAALMQAAETPMLDLSSAASRVPLIARVPSTDAPMKDLWQLIDFGTDFDKSLPELIEMTLRRVAISLHVPPETVYGASSAELVITAYMVKDETVRVYLAPSLTEQVTWWTRRILWPLLEPYAQVGGLRHPIQRYKIWYDTVRMTSDVDRTETATQAYDRAAVSQKAYLDAIGFSVGDAPDRSEIRDRVLLELARKGASSDEAAQYLRMLSRDPA